MTTCMEKLFLGLKEGFRAGKALKMKGGTQVLITASRHLSDTYYVLGILPHCGATNINRI